MNGVGPAWQGLYLSERLLEDGTTVLADEAYLAESIIDPHAKQVAGWTNRMPVVAVPDAVVADMIAYMKELDSPTVDPAPSTATR